jgi:hypothetical protein
MIKLTAICQTVSKDSHKDSSSLPPSSLTKHNKGAVINTTKLTYFDVFHAKLDDNKFIYLPHWNISFAYNPNESMENNIIACCLANRVTSVTDVAYVLATAKGESEFKLVKEFRGRILTPSQATYWHTGYYGRGLVQLTHKENYVKVGKLLGVDLVNNPDLMLTPEIAIKTLVLGMRDGLFTGRKLMDYKAHDYFNKRMIINPGEVKYKSYHHINQKFVRHALAFESKLFDMSKVQ